MKSFANGFGLLDSFSASNEDVKQRLMDMICDIKTAMLTTVSADAALRSRPMMTLECEPSGVLWFLTSEDQGLVQDLGKDPRINLAFSHLDKHQFISINGLAETVADKDKIEELWQPSFRAWFPEGPESGKIAALKVYIQDAEYWDIPNNRIVEVVSFARAILSGQSYQMVDSHQRISFEGGAQI